jgi:hypothetical protein
MKFDKFKANAIFLQPTWSCAKNCNGCYVKEKESKFGSEEMDYSIWTWIFQDMIQYRAGNNRNIDTKQITLALDTLPKTSARHKMQEIANSYLSYVAEEYDDRHDLGFEKRTEYHMTVNSVHDLEQYDFYHNKALDLVSISHLNNADEIYTIKDYFPNAKINYNVMSGDFAKQVKSKGIDHVKAILRNVDSVYYLLHKAPMGLEGHDFNAFFEGLAAINLFKNPPQQQTDGQACPVPDLASKFIFDGCMNDAKYFSKTGYGCSANVSRFQIWPDGRVTGCAYNSHNQYGKFAESFDDVLDNIRDAKTRYEFSTCTIPSGLKEYSTKKHLQVVT